MIREERNKTVYLMLSESSLVYFIGNERKTVESGSFMREKFCHNAYFALKGSYFCKYVCDYTGF